MGRARTLARILYFITTTLILGLILLIVLAIIFHPTVTADSNQAIMLSIVIGETIGSYLAIILLIGGVAAGFLAATSETRKMKIIHGIISFLMLAVGIMSLIYTGGGLPIS